MRVLISMKKKTKTDTRRDPSEGTKVVVGIRQMICLTLSSPLHVCFETKSELVEKTCPAGLRVELGSVGRASYLFEIFALILRVDQVRSFVASSCCDGRGSRLGI